VRRGRGSPALTSAWASGHLRAPKRARTCRSPCPAGRPVQGRTHWCGAARTDSLTASITGRSEHRRQCLRTRCGWRRIGDRQWSRLELSSRPAVAVAFSTSTRWALASLVGVGSFAAILEVLQKGSW